MNGNRNWWLLLAVGVLAVFSLPAILTKTSIGPISFNSESANIASTIGGIVGTILSFLTVLILVITTVQGNQDKRFQQTLDLIEKAVTLYAASLNDYRNNGKEKQYIIGENSSPGFGIGIGVIEPYLKTLPIALFDIISSYLSEGRFTKLQHRSLITLFVLQLEPIIQEIYEELMAHNQQSESTYPKVEIKLRHQLSSLENLRTYIVGNLI